MEIEVHRYGLTSRAALNARSEATQHEGALIRKDGGYGCIHPHPELGDAPVGEQLRLLAAGGSSPLLEAALRCAQADGAARRKGESLFANEIPASHWLARAGDDPVEVRAAGFDTVKLKLGRDPEEEAAGIQRWGGEGFRLRLDSNESLSLSTFLEFWEKLGKVSRKVEFVEDPIPWNPESWRILREVGVPVAVDRDAESRFEAETVAVIKPAVSDWLPPGTTRFLVTSYMDHAVGQMWAAAEAARLGAGNSGHRLLTCGLLTHHCFEPDPFFAQIETCGPRLMPPGGTGLGFDELLESLEWKPLI